MVVGTFISVLLSLFVVIFWGFDCFFCELIDVITPACMHYLNQDITLLKLCWQ